MRYRKGVPSLLNEVEGEQLTKKTEPEQMIKILNREYPETAVVLTLGGDGAVYAAGGEAFLCPARVSRGPWIQPAQGIRLPAIFLRP